MSNLCQEITLLLSLFSIWMMKQGDCIVYSISNQCGQLRDTDDLEELCDLAVRSLDEIIDYQVSCTRR